MIAGPCKLDTTEEMASVTSLSRSHHDENIRHWLRTILPKSSDYSSCPERGQRAKPQDSHTNHKSARAYQIVSWRLTRAGKCLKRQQAMMKHLVSTKRYGFRQFISCLLFTDNQAHDLHIARQHGVDDTTAFHLPNETKIVGLNRKFSSQAQGV